MDNKSITSDNSRENQDSGRVNEVTWDNSVRMLEYFQQEWQYRHSHFWNICIKLFILNIIVTMLPFTSEIFGIIISVNSIPSIIFSITGCIISILALVIMNDESKKLMAVGKVKYRINNQMNDLYKYHSYVDDMSRRRNLLAGKLPKYIFIFQLIVNGFLISYYFYQFL